MELGADVLLESEMAWFGSALHHAATSRKESTLALLLDADVPINHRNARKMTPLIAAAHERARACLRLLLERRGDALEINAQDEQGLTALSYAAWMNDAESVTLLLNAGADHNIGEFGRGVNCTAPLSRARYFRNAECIAILAEPYRVLALLKARALLDAAVAIPKAAQDARDKGLSFPG